MRIYTRFIIFLVLLAAFLPASAQKFTISGYVEDAATGEKLPGANVYDTKLLAGTTTNVYGFFSLTLPADSVSLAVSYVGYQTYRTKMFLKEDIRLMITLTPNIELAEVEIVEQKIQPIQERTQMSSIDIPIAQIKSAPALLGEVDVMKVLQMLPGVHSGGEGSSGLYVRGGGPDQNLILLDGVPVYNASHLFGFFSVFNADAIKNVELMKGGFPARYGGRLSSVVDITMKEGNMKEFAGEGSIGIIASKVTFEGPIIKDKTSFIVSGRRTYIDLLMAPFVSAATQGQGSFGYYFYDLNGKINHIISDKDRLYFSIYSGTDKFYAEAEDSYQSYEFSTRASLGWGNITSAFRWNHIVNNKLFSNTTLTFSRYNFLIGAKLEQKTPVSQDAAEMRYNSGILDWSGRVDFDYLPSPDHYIKFGLGAIHHNFSPGAIVQKIQFGGSTALDTSWGTSNIPAQEFSVYAEDDYRITAKLKANLGIHAGGFLVRGKLYPSLQPRISARYLLTNEWAVKASYSIMQQNIHLLSNTGISLPTDLWVPATEKVVPEIGIQYAAGVARSLFNDTWEASFEAYYKTMSNILEFKPGASFASIAGEGTGNPDWEDKVEAGKGWSYGGELFLQKKLGKTTGWIGYTLSWTNRQFENLNFGKVYPYRYDRRHDISFVISHKFSENFEIAGNWVYGTGNAVTLPLTRYMAYSGQPQMNFYNNEIEYFEEKNGFRMRAYHRMDIGFTFRKQKKWGERSWTLGLYNAYSRKNPYFLYFGYDNFGQGRRVLKQFSLFPILPSFSFNVKF